MSPYRLYALLDPVYGSAPGTGTLSATPLAWTHAQLSARLVDRRRASRRAPERRRVPLREAR